jgi:hypothetical protein
MTATVRLLARGMIWIEGPRRLYRLQLTRGRNGDEKSNFRTERNLSNKTRALGPQNWKNLRVFFLYVAGLAIGRRFAVEEDGCSCARAKKYDITKAQGHGVFNKFGREFWHGISAGIVVTEGWKVAMLRSS